MKEAQRLPVLMKDHAMRDEYEDRFQRHARADTNRMIDGMIARIMHSFRVLHRIHYAAPWQGEKCRLQ